MNVRAISKTLLGSLFLVSALALAMADPDPDGASHAERPRRVRVAEVSAATVNRTVRFSGVTRAARRAELGFTLGARLIDRPAESGQSVRAGAVLARLDRRELENAVREAEAGIADVTARRIRADAELRRVERLHTANAATSEELDQATAGAAALSAALDAASTRLRDTRRLLSETTLAAPFAGVITEVRYQPGEFVPAGRPVVVLSGSGALETEVALPESVVHQVSEGDRVRVELPIAGLATGGAVARVGRAAAPGGGLYPALVGLEAVDGLLAGMTAEVAFELAAADALAVPLAAVLNPGGAHPRVFRLQGDSVEPVEIEVLELVGERVAVKAQLAAGDEVVVTGHAALVPGDRVEVLR